MASRIQPPHVAGRRGGSGSRLRRGIGLGSGPGRHRGRDDQRPGSQRDLQGDPQEGRLARLRGRRRGIGLRPDPGPLRRGRGHVRPHGVRPADHHPGQRRLGSPTWPSRSTPNADYTVWTITLRPNVVFHDGTPCDGAALLTNFQAQQASLLTGPGPEPDPRRRSPRPGPLAVTITMKAPWVPFPLLPGRRHRRPVRLHGGPVHAGQPDSGTSHPVGTGPFVFQEWVPNDHFTATANPHYWRTGMPYLDKITYKPIPDAEARAEALKSGHHRHHAHRHAPDHHAVPGQQELRLHRRQHPRRRRARHELRPAQPVRRRRSTTPSVRQAAAMAINRQPVRQGDRRRTSSRSATACSPRARPTTPRRLPGLQPVRGQEAGQAGGEGHRRTRSPSPRVDQLAGRHQGRRSTSSRPGRRWDSRSRRTSSSRTTSSTCPGRHVPGAGVAAVRGGRPRPQLHLLEHHHRQLRARSRSTWPATPTRPWRPPCCRAGQPRAQRPGQAAYQTVNKRLRHRPPLPVDRPGRVGRRRQAQRCRTSTTRPRRRAKAYGMIGGSIWPTQIWIELEPVGA